MSTALIDKIVHEKSPSKLLTYLKKQSPESLAVTSPKDPLEYLNPAVHSLGYLFILKSRLLYRSNIDTSASLCQRTNTFLREFDNEKVRASPLTFHDVVSIFAELCDGELNAPILALDSIKAAIHRYAKSPSALTSIHYIYIKQCLLARCYEDALGILDIQIDDLDLGTELIYQYYLWYFYYGCLVYISLKDFPKAENFALMVITAPASACSAIQLEAYKKYILINLILKGHPTPIPSVVSNHAVRAFRYLTKPYEDFARAVNNHDALVACMETNYELFMQDRNGGLVAQVVERQEMRRIAALRKVYMAISLEDVARKIIVPARDTIAVEDIQRIEGLIMQMIDEGMVNAKISGNPPIVTFSEEVAIPDRRELEHLLSEASAINAKLREFNKEVSLSKSYIGKMAGKQAGTRMSPVEGESEFPRGMKMADPMRKSLRNEGKMNSFDRNKFPNVPYDDRMED